MSSTHWSDPPSHRQIISGVTQPFLQVHWMTYVNQQTSLDRITSGNGRKMWLFSVNRTMFLDRSLNPNLIKTPASLTCIIDIGSHDAMPLLLCLDWQLPSRLPVLECSSVWNCVILDHEDRGFSPTYLFECHAHQWAVCSSTYKQTTLAILWQRPEDQPILYDFKANITGAGNMTLENVKLDLTIQACGQNFLLYPIVVHQCTPGGYIQKYKGD